MFFFSFHHVANIGANIFHVLVGNTFFLSCSLGNHWHPETRQMNLKIRSKLLLIRLDIFAKPTDSDSCFVPFLKKTIFSFFGL